MFIVRVVGQFYVWVGVERVAGKNNKSESFKLDSRNEIGKIEVGRLRKKLESSS